MSKPPTDWAQIQIEYEAGVLSVPQISRNHGLSDSAVSVRASRHGWLRDPTARARIVADREAILAKELELRRERVIAVSAQQQSQVLVSHRTDIQRARKVVSTLLDELTQLSDPASQASLDHIADLLAAPDERGNLDRLNKVYRRVISMPDRISGINMLSTALKTLIMLERQAYSIEGKIEDPEAERPQEEVVKGLDAIMDKFNQVLALQVSAPQSTTPEPEVVVDVSRPVKAPAPARAV